MNLPFFKKSLPIFHFWTILVFLYFSGRMITPRSVFNQDRYTAGEILGFETLLPAPAPYPFNNNVFLLPDLSAQSAIAVDLDSMVTLYEKMADARLLPASTTKIMTALIALENYQIDQILTYNKKETPGTTIGLKTGEKMTVESLLYGMLIGSGNDAADAIADSFPGGRENFITVMNGKAQELNLANTQFTNPMGLDEENHYSSARDLARLAAVAIKNPLFAKIVATPEITITDISGVSIHRLKNTNELIGKMETARGIKTGKTDKAGECLVALFDQNSHKIITVVLNSFDRIGETKIMANWIFNNFYWDSLTPKLSYRR